MFHNLIKKLAMGLLFLSAFLVEKGRANTPQKPLWTPEDYVTLPEETICGISSDGKYTLLNILHILLQEDEIKEYSTCVLVNNDTLEKEIIGGLNHNCVQPQFIGKGQFFSYITEEGKISILFVQETSSKKKNKIQTLRDNFQEYTFAPDGKSFAFLTDINSKQGDSARTILGFQKVNKSFQPIGSVLLKAELNLYSPFIPSSYQWSPDSQKIAFVSIIPLWKSESKVTLYLLDVKQDKLEKIDEVIGFMRELSFSPDGQKLAFIKGDGLGEQKIPLKRFPDQKRPIIHIVDLHTGEAVSIDAVDIWHIAGWKENNKALIVTKQVGTKQLLYSLDIETKKLTLMEVPDLTCIRFPILSLNRKYIGFSGENLHHPSAIYISNLDSFSPKKISSLNEKINLTALKATPITWKSYDGLKIEGILTYPQGYKEGQKVPLVVSIHGGPAGVESQQFIGNTSFGSFSPAVFASQGYATLVVNYRGSLGYGEEFKKIDYKDLGGGDYKDIMTGIDYLVNKGIADSDQLFITGHSYGGFLTAWAIGHTHRFKAAIIEAGIVDWISDNATTDAPPPMEALFGGPYWEDYELWRKTSPIRYVSNMKTPTLIIQGLDDDRVSMTQSMQIYNALKARKIPTRLIYYTGQGHGIGSLVAIRDAMNEMLKWMKAYRGKQEAMEQKKEE